MNAPTDRCALQGVNLSRSRIFELDEDAGPGEIEISLLALAAGLLLEGVGGTLLIKRSDFDRMVGRRLSMSVERGTRDIRIELMGRPMN